MNHVTVGVIRDQECLAGFYLLEARDLNEAIALAARIPRRAMAQGTS